MARSRQSSSRPYASPRRPTPQSSRNGTSDLPETPTHPRAMNGSRGRGNGRRPPAFVPYITRPAARVGDAPQNTNTFMNNNRAIGGPNANQASHTNFATRPRSPILRPSEDWMKWKEVSLKVRRLPHNINTWDLWEAFKSHGTIIFIELFQGKDGGRDGTAKIRFMPPPRKDFWSAGPFRVLVKRGPVHEDVIIAAEVTLAKKTRNWTIPSPVRKHVSYPETMQVSSLGVDFGFMVDPHTMMIMKSAPALPPIQSTPSTSSMPANDVVFKPQNQGNPSAIEGDLDRINFYMVWIPFEQIDKIHSIELDDGHTSLVLSLDSPPCFFRKRADIKASHVDEANSWSEMDTWYRQTDIIYDPIILRTKPLSLNKGEVEIDIGRWTTYRFVLPKYSENFSVFRDMREALKDFNIPVLPLEGFETTPRVDPNFWALIDHRAPLSLMSLIDENHFQLPFEIRYQLEVCISQGVFHEHNLTAEFLAALSKLVREDSAKARSILEYFGEMESRVHDPMTIFENKEARGRAIKTKIPHYCAYVRKATITPSGILYSTPTVETTNRVIRHFSDVGDRFLRVQFTDEKTEGRISSNVDKVKNNELYTRVFRTLSNGIVIGDRKYEFLAYGNSQFRQNGAYFFCPSDTVSCNNIRAWMGDFCHIKVVAKYAARLGQCFSTTRAIHGGTRVELGTIEDIERNGHNFTDGVGKISSLLAQIVATELGLPIADHVPSAFQFRLGGCKGILVVWPDVTGKQIKVRPSQQKFEAVYNGLEIIRCSQFSTATLNRQTITILSALGVEDDVFIDMLIKQLSNYETAMTDRSMALSLLQKWIDENNMTITIASMILNGFMDGREPFVMSLLHLWRAWSIKLLKEKAKIMVEKGAFVFGCIDETGTLKGHKNDSKAHGKDGKQNQDDLPQIFLQIPDAGKYRVVEGLCVLGRNPSLHPGDIRVVMAVDVPALRHLRDVVVFPQLGDRDIPSMCSGGDLDGDDFFVIWDQELIPLEWNLQSMNYDAPAAREKSSGPVVVEDLMKFFVKFVKNDSLPTIAHAHLANSDFMDRGVKDPVCLKLAELHSKAVDYVKNGEPAVMPKSLRPRKWPHFMEKKYKPKEQLYRSGKILGQLYDRVEAVDFVPQYTESFDKRILKAYKLDSAMLKRARQIKTQYDTAMKRIMAQMEIKTEFEIYTTFILSKPRVGTDYKLHEEMAGISDGLKDRFRSACIEAAGGSKDFAKLAPFVAAMYQVTWEEMQIALAECKTNKIVGGIEVPKRKMIPKFMPLTSFPWIFHEVLGRIAAGTDAQQEMEDLGMVVLKPAAAEGSRRRRVVSGEEEVDQDDFVQTEEGITHRGEVLDLFRPDENSDVEGGEEDMSAFGDDDEGDRSLNTRARNLEIETRQLDSAGYIAPHDETNHLEDEFDGVELDGFLNPSRDNKTVSTAVANPDHETSQGHSSTSGDDTQSTPASSSSTPSFNDLNDIAIAARARAKVEESSGDHPDSPTGSALWSDSAGVEKPVSGVGGGVDKAGDEDEEYNSEEEVVTLSDTEEETPLEQLRRLYGGGGDDA